MTDYKSYEDARSALDKNGLGYCIHDRSLLGKRPKLEHDEKTYIEGYARICEFLSDHSLFEDTIAGLSAHLWWVYRNDPSRSNKFTRAISAVAGQYNFRVNNRTEITTDPSMTTPMQFKLVEGEDNGLGWLLRNRLFWKDSMEAQHGEHSHSIQWLAIAARLGTKIPVAELYSRSGDFVMRQDRNKYGNWCRVWQWLADAFPPSMAAGKDTVLKKTRDNLTVTTYRSPQNIMHHLLPATGPIEGHFLSNYLHMRYNKKKWFKSGEGKFGGFINGDARFKVEQQPDRWQPSKLKEARNRFNRTDLADPRLANAAIEDEKERDKRYGDKWPYHCKFHGTEGYIYMQKV